VKLELSKLKILQYPDPFLRKRAAPVERVDGDVRALASRMLALMREHKGVGLAGIQVGVPLRIFVMNPTGESQDERVIINPVISDLEGQFDAEEGCLSIPGVNVQIRRAARCRLTAQDLNGAALELVGEGLVSRIWQHETDHLNGMLIIDRMKPGDRIATRKTLEALEAAYKARKKH
jgi:peptide deformylase